MLGWRDVGRAGVRVLGTGWEGSAVVRADTVRSIGKRRRNRIVACKQEIWHAAVLGAVYTSVLFAEADDVGMDNMGKIFFTP